MRLCSASPVVAFMLACAPRAQPSISESTAPASAPAPWSEPALASDVVPPVYLTVWREAANRTTCALLAPERLDPSLQRRATPRAATFSGGWAVAYDLPDTRSAFGIAGSGVNVSDANIYDDWPEKRVFADGSRAGYGPEGGGAGPNWLAYVRIPGQQCLYNVWSRLGQRHLEELLGQLRFVTPSADGDPADARSSATARAGAPR